MTHGFLDELRWRGLLHQQTAEAPLMAHLRTPGRVGYAGFDPTADSLTIGNLIPITMLRHFQRAGHVPIALLGGGTGLIGDPSGKDAERKLRSREEIEANIAGQRPIFERLLDFDGPCAARMVNNLDWLEPIGYLEMLRDVGKHFSVNQMIQKDSVRTRLEGREHGISYTEFSYMLLQAYDFLHLHRDAGCTVQMAGSDQYGNIVAGIDLIRRELARERIAAGAEGGADAEDYAYGVTAPLVTRSDGQKIGKTADGAIWLTAERTSPYRFYQYWMNVPDADVGAFLRWYTFLEREAIEAIEAEHDAARHQRGAQRTLARELTTMLHGADATASVERATQALFTGAVAGLSEAELAEVVADLPCTDHPRASLGSGGMPLLELLPETTLASSKREAREFLGNGAISVNGEKVAADAVLRAEDLLPGGVALLRRGKKAWHATRWA